MATPNEISETEHITCECGHSLLKVQVDTEIQIEYPHNSNKEYMLAMYYYGAKGYKTSFFRRLKFALGYIKTGYLYSDQICMNESEAKKLKDFLEKHL